MFKYCIDPKVSSGFSITCSPKRTFGPAQCVPEFFPHKGLNNVSSTLDTQTCCQVLCVYRTVYRSYITENLMAYRSYLIMTNC